MFRAWKNSCIAGCGIAAAWRATGVGLATLLLAIGLSQTACSQRSAPGGGGAPATASATADLPPYERIEPRTQNVRGAYLHRWSGLALPERAGDFRRSRVVQFDAAALDVSGEYRLNTPQGVVLANVYVYPMSLISTTGEKPSEADCEAEFDGMDAIIRQRFPDAEMVREWREVRPAGLGQDAGRAAAYDFETDILGSTMPVRSEAHLFCGTDSAWAVKYRITYPRAFDAKDAIEAFIASSPAQPDS